MVFIQIVMEIRDVHNIGKQRWWQVLVNDCNWDSLYQCLTLQKSFPAKILYKVSLLLTLLIVPTRLACGFNKTLLLLDNMFSLLAVILTTMHFLFYCRAIKFVGPFVLMVGWAQAAVSWCMQRLQVYTIITRDMIRFFLVYAIFLMGFSQGFYVMFSACERDFRFKNGCKSITCLCARLCCRQF